MLIIDEIKSTSMQLSSSFIQDAVQYEIIYYPTKEPEYDAMVTLHGHNVQRIIDDLDADTFYTFKLRAVMNDNTHTDWTDAVYTTGKWIYLPRGLNSLNNLISRLVDGAFALTSGWSEVNW